MKPERIRIPKETVADFCRRNHIRRLSLFGSVLHEDFHQDSDVDMLVEFQAHHIPGLFALAGMESALSLILGRTVDLRTPADLSRYFREEVTRTAEVQYAEE